jgi:uncharacterized protein YlxW (UPF0749 family)
VFHPGPDGRRVVASTWLGPAEGGAVVDGARVGPPYELEAIGPPDVIAEAMDIPGGPLSVLSALPGVTAEVRQEEALALSRAEPG